MFQRKNKGFHFGERNNELEEFLISLTFFCNIKVIKPVKLQREIQGPSEKHFYDVRRVLYGTFPMFKACVETEKRI